MLHSRSMRDAVAAMLAAPVWPPIAPLTAFSSRPAAMVTSSMLFRRSKPAGATSGGLPLQLLEVRHQLAGLVPDVLEAYPEVTLVGSKVALTYLKSLAQRPFAEQPVKCVHRMFTHAKQPPVPMLSMQNNCRYMEL